MPKKLEMLKNYPWNSAEDPNSDLIMEYIWQIKSHATKSVERSRLTVIFEFLYNKFGIRKIKTYNFHELNSLAFYINSLTFRKQKKIATYLCLKKLMDYCQIDYLAEQFSFIFEEAVYPWNSPDDPNRKYIVDYLLSITNTHTKDRERKKLSWDFKFLYEHFGKQFVLNYTAKQFRSMFQEIDLNLIQKSSKMRFMTAMYNLISHIIDPELAENKQFDRNYDYIFNQLKKKNFFNFRETGKNRFQKYYFTAEEFTEFLHKLKWEYHNLQDYILFALMGYSSVRGIGICNLKVKDIDLDICYFDTQDKMTKVSSGWNRYFFPKELAPEIRAFLMQNGFYDQKFQLRKERKNWPIFRTSHSKPLTPKLIREKLVGIYCVPFRNHDFRRSIKKLWKEAKMDIVDRRTLSNQIQDVEGKYSAEDPWRNPIAVQKILQKYTNQIFS
ncbi:site-specific integrase [Candidatus Lokiarchaeum ossiferum]|uniref:site-specific integrase n=1 Tax=Candidatus Lokiarchaeum ossiferum TaxID=2951803 RepID=UPI00352DC03D